MELTNYPILSLTVILSHLQLSRAFESIKLDKLKHVIAVDQVGKTASKSFFVHPVPGSDDSQTLLTEVVAASVGLVDGKGTNWPVTHTYSS